MARPRPRGRPAPSPRGQPAAPRKPIDPRARKWLFRLGALAVSGGLLGLLEIGLWLCGAGDPDWQRDPFVGFHQPPPLFRRVDDFFAVAPNRLEFFRPQQFPVKKPADGVRIFCLGGSTVQGRPYATESAFSTWLELSLQAAQPQRSWEVINCGGVSYASYRLVPLLQETLNYEPDLYIVYTGHNEFLEARSYADYRETPAWLVRTHQVLSRLRTYRVAHQWVVAARTDALPAGPAEPRRAAARDAQLREEVDALLDHRGGLEAYRRDDRYREAVVAHYQYNLRRLIALAERAGVPVILCEPVENLADSPPFKSSLSDLAPQRQQRFGAAWERAQHHADLPGRIDALVDALQSDPRNPNAHYQLGQCYLAAADFARARQHLVRAKDEDLCPLRMLESMHDVVRRVAATTGTPLVDCRGLLESVSRHGIPGRQWLKDHVHPTIEGHQLIADALLQKLVQLGHVVPQANWKSRRREAYRRHFQEVIDEAYMAEGEARLRGLQLWTQGRAGQFPPIQAPPKP